MTRSASAACRHQGTLPTILFGKKLAPVGGRAIGASISKTQSPSPALFLPGGVNCLLPVFANGEPLTSIYSPFVGSYQRAVDIVASFDMSTVTVRIDGM